MKSGFRVCLNVIVAAMTTSATPGAHAQPQEAPEIQSESSVTLPELASDKQWKGYVPIARSRLNDLLRQREESSQQPDRLLQRIEFQAKLSGTLLVDGTFTMQLPRQVGTDESGLALGHTNLDSLNVFSSGTPVPLAIRKYDGLVPLVAVTSESLSGTWTATGTRRGRSILFDLKLPKAAVSVFQLRTKSSIQVSSPNALVVLQRTILDEATWKLYPNSPKQLTINCADRNSGTGPDAAFLGVAADIQIGRGRSTAVWVIESPSQIDDGQLTFQIEKSCRVQSVRLSENIDPEWSVTNGRNTNSLTVSLPSAFSGSVFTIRCELAETDAHRISLPFLKPTQFKTANQESGKLYLQSSTVRLTVAPQLVVERLQLNGACEQSVSYSGDGSQVTELVQHSAEAEATITLSDSVPLISDEVLVTLHPSGATATAYVRVAPRTGTVSNVGWSIPGSWRVTEVRELTSENAPLLFRVSPENNSDRTTQLNVSLRTPLTSGQSQRLTIQLQSIEGPIAATQQPAGLFNSKHHRTHDYVMMPANAENPFRNSWSTKTLTADELAELLPWLPFDGTFPTVAYSRKSIQPTLSTKLPDKEVFAAVDYNVDVQGQMVVESVRIRVQSPTGLPPMIPMLISSDCRPIVSSTKNQVVLSRVKAGDGMDEWVVDTAPDSQLQKELDFTLETTRELQPEAQAMIVEFPEARKSGGTIQPPPEDSGLTLNLQLNDSSLRLMEPVQYPDTDFNLQIRRSEPFRSHQRVSAQTFVLMNQRHRGRSVEYFCRCLVQSSPDKRVLQIQVPAAEARLYVNGDPIYHDTGGDLLLVPLPESESATSVGVYIESVGLSDQESLKLPLIAFPNADSADLISCFLPDSNLTLELGANLPELRLAQHSSAQLGRFIQPASGNPLSSENDAAVRFASRWMLQAGQSQNAYVFAADRSAQPTTMQLIDKRNDIVWVTIWSVITLAICLYRAPQMRSCGLALLLILIVQQIAFQNWVLPTYGILWGTVLFVSFSTFRNLLSGMTPHIPEVARLHRASTISLLIATASLLTPSVYAQSDADVSKPRIIIPLTESDTFPLAYVEQTYLDSLRAAADSSKDEVAVLESTLTVTLESVESGFAEIQCVVATLNDKNQFLEIPLSGVTLVKSMHNGELIFPTHDSDGKTKITFAKKPHLSDITLSSKDEGERTYGPGEFGQWQVSTVEYTVRFVARNLGAESRCTIPFPMSPKANVSVLDPMEGVESTEIVSEGLNIRANPGSKPNEFVFAEIFNREMLELTANIKGEDKSIDAQVEQAEVVVDVAAEPGVIRMTCEYQLTPADPRATHIAVGVSPHHRVTRVESKTGESIPWTAVDNNIVAQVSAEESGLQHLVVRQMLDTPLSRQKKIDIGNIARVNGRRSDSTMLQIRTSEQFIVQAIRSESALLQQLPSQAPRESESSRGVERRVMVPPLCNSVQIDLTERTATQEPNLFQEVVIGDDRINWKCVCETEISGQPVFRQVIFVSEDVAVDEVSATVSGTTRLQSWTRTKNSVIISLREATRGTLEIQVAGTLNRTANEFTTLPVVSFPAPIQVFQSSMDLSATTRSPSYIHSFGGAQPDERFEISTPLSTDPISLSITDDTRPISIRNTPEQILAAEITVVIYESAGQIRAAQVISLTPSDPSSPVRFRLGSADASRTPRVVRNDSTVPIEFIDQIFDIPATKDLSTDGNMKLVISDLIPTSRDGAISIHVPEFDAAINVNSCVALDVRESARQAGTNVLRPPSWAVAALKEVDSVLIGSDGQMQLSTYDADTRLIRIRQSSSPETVSASPSGTEEIYVDCEHLLQPEQHGQIGTTSLMVFASHAPTELKINIPDDIMTTQVSINEQCVLLATDGNSVTLSIPHQVAHVLLEWTRSNSLSPSGKADQIRLPKVLSSRSRDRVTINSPNNAASWWTVVNPTHAESVSNEERDASLLTGLRLVEADSATPDLPTAQGLGSPLSDAVRTELYGQAEIASRSLHSFLNRLNASETIHLSTANSVVEVSLTRLPSFATCTSVIFAVVLILIPWVQQRTNRGETVRNEMDTAVSDAQDSVEAEPITKISEDASGA